MRLYYGVLALLASSEHIGDARRLLLSTRPDPTRPDIHYSFNDFVVALIGFCVGVAKQSFAAGCAALSKRLFCHPDTKTYQSNNEIIEKIMIIGK